MPGVNLHALTTGQGAGQAIGMILLGLTGAVASGQLPIPPQYSWVTGLAGAILALFTHSDALVNPPAPPAPPVKPV